MLYILDHYIKYLFGKLLLNKKADNLINSLEEIFLLTGFPKEIGAYNVREFSNAKFKKFLFGNDIKFISGLWKPT